MKRGQNMLQLSTPEGIQELLAQRVVWARKRLNWNQDELAKRAGVSRPTVSRFERTGVITLVNFLKLSHALGRLDELANFLDKPEARTLAELEEQVRQEENKRGRK